MGEGVFTSNPTLDTFVKFYLQLFKSINPLLRWLLAIAFSTIILVDFFLVNIPERFQGGERIGVIVDRLCLSYISTFIFLYFGTQYKSFKDKKNLKGYIEIKLLKIVGQAFRIIGEMKYNTKVAVSGVYPDDNELTLLMTNLNPNSNAPVGMAGRFLTWFEYL